MQCKLLIVEDDPDIAQLLKDNIKDLCPSTKVVCTDNAHVAESAVESGEYNVLITDMSILGLDAIYLSEVARKLGMFTVVCTATHVMDIPAKKFDFILPKPFSRDDIQRMQRAIKEGLGTFKEKILSHYRRFRRS